MFKKTGFLSRLSHLIVIQVIFVFSALTLILFDNQSSKNSDRIFASQSAFEMMADSIGSSITPHREINGEVSLSGESEKLLSNLFGNNSQLECAEIFILSKENILTRTYYAECGFLNNDESDTDEIMRLMNSNNIILQRINDKASSGFYSSNYLVNYVPFNFKDSTQAILVTVSSHDYLIANKSHLKYTLLLLFLVTALINLLLVYLISKRFKAPLQKLIYGLQKTSEGELYHIVELEGDSELLELAESFNKMSNKLWNNFQEHKKQNSLLENANKLLSESQNSLTTLIDNSPDCILSTSLTGDILFSNSRAMKIFGYENAEIKSLNVNDIFCQKIFENDKSDDKFQETRSYECLAKQKNSELLPVYVYESPVFNEEAQVKAYIFIIRDISESKGYQDMMIRLDRYYTRGEMMGHIAHDINNYLSVLSGNLELFPIFLKKGDKQKIEQKMGIMKETIDKIILFSNGLMEPHKEKAVFEKINMNQLVENMVAFLKPQPRFDHIKVTTELSLEMQQVYLDAGQIQQLIVNFIYNAADALNSDENNSAKKIIVRTMTIDDNNSQKVRVEVIDNGPGIGEEKQGKLFKHRFTTKKTGHGIGLVTCAKIIESHHGFVGYRSDNGAVFYFDIPLEQPIKSSEEKNEILIESI